MNLALAGGGSLAPAPGPGLLELVGGALGWLATVVANAGRDLITDFTDGTVAVPANWYVAWGTGVGTAAATDTTLFTESADEARTASTKTQPVSTTNRMVGTITCATNAKTITNAGIFSASSVGTLLIKGDFTGIALAIGDAIQFTIDLQN
jgi:hypothetical protein